MNDRELLELAAKAAGIPLIEWGEDWQTDNGDLYGAGFIAGTRPELFYWNPLTDDGDAFRLAVKLHMATERVVGSKAAGWLADQRTEQLDTGDACETLRRAIVRAAAKIGEAIQDAQQGRAG